MMPLPAEILDKTESSFAVRAALASWSSYDAPNAINGLNNEIEGSTKQDQYCGWNYTRGCNL